jgi:hypothetical protein
MPEKSEMCMQAAQPGPQHESLARFAGRWRAEVKIWMGPGEPMVSTGVMTNTMVLGGRFLEQSYADDSGMFEGRGFWGYNNVDECYEGFWIDAMSTMFQLESGQHDASKDVYSMSGSMTNPETKQKMSKRSVITFVGPDEHTMEMFFSPEGMPEMRSMHIRYTRA